MQELQTTKSVIHNDFQMLLVESAFGAKFNKTLHVGLASFHDNKQVLDVSCLNLNVREK